MADNNDAEAALWEQRVLKSGDNTVSTLFKLISLLMVATGAILAFVALDESGSSYGSNDAPMLWALAVSLFATGLVNFAIARGLQYLKAGAVAQHQLLELTRLNSSKR